MSDPRGDPLRPTRSARAAALLAASCTAGCSDFFLQGQDEPEEGPLRVSEEWVQAPLPAVDVLWVVDDTPSMAAEHAALADAASAFVAALDAADLAWQVGVVTTDLSQEDAGRLRGNPWVVAPGLDDPAAALAAAAQVGAQGGAPAGGLGAAALALAEPLRSGDNRGFRRPDAALHVVVFSDGDDESEAVLGPDPVAAFVDLTRLEADRTGRAAQLSAVVGDSGFGCIGEGGTALPGDRYRAAAEATGGATGSICAGDFAPVLAELGTASAEWPRRFALQAVPAAGTERVWVDGVAREAGWSVDRAALQLVFDAAPSPDVVVRMSYVVAEAAPVDTGGAP